jgi:two-component system OmpR family sensor kinase
VPWELVVLALLGGLAFSASLAWYLTRPIQRLRVGFDRLAAGHLATRLGPTMGRRRDEIADLAHDFDVMAAQLQQLVAAREQLLHDVSHELRSPLARLQVAIGLARQNPQRIAATLERVEAEARRLDELVGEVLTLSRAESGAPQLDDYFDLAGLVHKVVADAQFEAQASGVHIAVEDRSVPAGQNQAAQDDTGQEGDTVFQGNAELMRRALENIVRNALHHSKAGQRVTVEIAGDAPGHNFVIRVADQGPGVAPEALTSIFDPFVRANNRLGERAAESTGFGLGLAIAKRAVLAHGGSIEAQNAAGEGGAGTGGLIVTIRLPFNAGALDVAEPV